MKVFQIITIISSVMLLGIFGYEFVDGMGYGSEMITVLMGALVIGSVGNLIRR